MPGPPTSDSREIEPWSYEAFQAVRDIKWYLESIISRLESAQYWTGRRLQHAERRLREQHTRWEEQWQLQETLDAARGLDQSVSYSLENARSSLTLILALYGRARPESKDVGIQTQDRPATIESATQVRWTPGTQEQGTQTSFLTPEGTCGVSLRDPEEIPEQVGPAQESADSRAAPAADPAPSPFLQRESPAEIPRGRASERSKSHNKCRLRSIGAASSLDEASDHFWGSDGK